MTELSGAGGGPASAAGAPGGSATVRVRAGGGSRDYDVHVGRGALDLLPKLAAASVGAHRWAVVSDRTVAALYGERVVGALSGAGTDVRLFAFPAGEAHKTRETWAALTDRLLDEGFGRDAAVVALGGGVTGDLAGFVAATFLRGVPVVQVPTSLVAMIDAAVGGKTGVDTPAGKNLVGAFHPPALVVVDPETSATLPKEERAQGLVEAVKHGLVLDAAYLRALEVDAPAALGGDLDATSRVVLRSVELKAEVVGKDEREAGWREVLNFGHTLGHALEAASGYGLSHGSAVAVGMVLEARIGERMGVTRAGTAEGIAGRVERLGLPSRVPRGIDLDAAGAFLGTDKKRRGGRVRCVLLSAEGSVHAEGGWSRPVPPDLLGQVLREG